MSVCAGTVACSLVIAQPSTVNTHVCMHTHEHLTSRTTNQTPTHCAGADLKLPVYDIYVADVDDQGGRKWIVTFDNHYHPNGTDTNNTARSSLAVSSGERAGVVAVRVMGASLRWREECEIQISQTFDLHLHPRSPNSTTTSPNWAASC